MEQIKKRINGIGKACRIIAIILTVLTCIGAGALLICGIAGIVLPENMLDVRVSVNTDVAVSGAIINMIPEDSRADVTDQVSKSTKVDGEDIEFAGFDENGTLIVHANGQSMDFSLRRAGVALLVYALSVGLLIYVLVMAARLMKRLEKCDSPFEEGVVKAMTGFAISLIPYAVLTPALSSIASGILTSRGFDINFGIDLTTAFAALVIILLIFIFKYGVQLQHQADETL